jgi:hypothetical protein
MEERWAGIAAELERTQAHPSTEVADALARRAKPAPGKLRTALP